MKILFLDIDGVCNCVTTAQRHRGTIGIDPYMAFLVGKIVLDTGCEVVLSSTWRLFADARAEVRKQVVKFIDVTPHLFKDTETGEFVPYRNTGGITSVERGHEIKAWLDLRSEPITYAILDDDCDMLPEQMPNFFKTSWSTGLTKEIAQSVTKHLNSTEKS